MILSLLLIAASFSRVDPRDLCVTNGAISIDPDGRIAIDTASSRAVLRLASMQAAEIRFRYLGPTAESKPLASGEMRRQAGLKLRAQDTCNLLYVMWHFEPDSRIGVSIKRNRGMHTHAECDAHGYTNIKPLHEVAVDRVVPGQSHTLRAELNGTALRVFADNRLAWEGDVGTTVNEFDGPVGLRTDNARIVFDYFARGVMAGAKPAPCHASPGD